MRRLLTTLVTIAFLIYPSVCLPSYIIELKTGGNILVNFYWKERDQIKFYFYGGVVGIHKNGIKSIKEMDKEEIGAQGDILIEEETDSSEVVIRSEETKISGKEAGAAKGEGEDIDTEYYKNRKKEIEEKYREAKKKLKQAIVDRDKLAQREAKKEIKELHDQISALSSELKEKNKGVLPVWW